MDTASDIDARILGVLQAGPGAVQRALGPLEAEVLAVHGQGTADRFVPALQRLCAAAPRTAGAWWLLGLALHDAQQHEAALTALERAAILEPAPRHLMAEAQLCYETGRAAAARFASLHARAPDDPRIVASYAGALAAEGDPRAAETLLARFLDRHPDWLEGQQRLARLRQTSGWPDFDAGFALAVERAPRHAGLRLGWFAELAKARRWEAAHAVVHDALATLGERPALLAARLHLLAESGAADRQPELFDALPPSGDPGIGLARVRHALRCGRPAAAVRLAESFVTTPAAAMFWPYLSLAWRLLGDARADWLDRPDAFVRVVDLGLGATQLSELATLLRALHTMSAPYLEQSVRGGTQTDRPLLFRHEAVIARLRAAILAAASDYVDALPAREAGHPLLEPARGRLRLAGSWSVRLHDQGFHACHTHPMGWISSACYIALPADPGPPPAGWLRLGTPPPELGLELASYREIAPRPGQLVLFPSTMWHGTAPFREGERLTVAFDLRPMP